MAVVSVKLVSEVGVGVIAAGVAKVCPIALFLSTAFAFQNQQCLTINNLLLFPQAYGRRQVAI